MEGRDTASVPVAGSGKRRALLICNGTFPKIPGYRLVGPKMDARSLGATLSDPDICGFTVDTLLDRGLIEVRREIERICAESGTDDTLLIYYSGNGRLGGDRSLYLAVADSEDSFLDATALDAEFILSQLRRSRCRKIVLLIDACFSGAFFNQNRGIPNGLYAITSCGAEETCGDSEEGGAFTVALCSGLRGDGADTDGDGQVSIDELHDFVKGQSRGGGGTPQKWVWNVPEAIYIANVQRPVFLSYAREDAEAADRLAGALEAESLSVWIDREGIRSGNWKERVTEGLNRSRALVVLLTEASLRSAAVRKELAFAARKAVPIIPVMLGKIDEDALPDWFTLDYDELHRHTLDPPHYRRAAQKLTAAVKRLRKPNADPVGSPT